MPRFSLLLGFLLLPFTVCGKNSDSAVQMLGPKNDQTIILKRKSPEITFKWKEENTGEKYYLALYFKGENNKPSVLRVSGESHRVKLKKVPATLLWTVFKLPADNEVMTVPKRIPKHRVRLQFYENNFKPHNALLRISALQATNNFQLKSSSTERKATLSGPLVEGNAEFFPADLGHLYSLNLYYRFSSQKKADNEVEQQRWALEFGRVLGQSSRLHHQIYAGLHFINSVDMKLGSAFDTSYHKRLISTRYLFRGQVNDRLALEANTGILMPVSFNAIPSLSLKVGPNIQLERGWWLDFFGLYENYLYKLKGSPGTGDITIRQVFTGFGMGLTKNW